MKYKMLANINGYKKGNIYDITSDEVKSFGKYAEKVEEKSSKKENTNTKKEKSSSKRTMTTTKRKEEKEG